MDACDKTDCLLSKSCICLHPGEVLQMSQYAGGIEPNGDMKFDIVIRGDVPDLGDVKTIALAPYKENYIQTGPGEDRSSISRQRLSIYTHSCLN